MSAKAAGRLGLDRAGPALVVHITEGLVPGSARVVDEDIDRVGRGPGFAREARRPVGVLQIGGENDGVVLEGRGHLVEALAVSARKDHLGAGGIERLGHRLTDPTRCSGDEGGAASKAKQLVECHG